MISYFSYLRRFFFFFPPSLPWEPFFFWEINLWAFSSLVCSRLPFFFFHGIRTSGFFAPVCALVPFPLSPNFLSTGHPPGLCLHLSIEPSRPARPSVSFSRTLFLSNLFLAIPLFYDRFSRLKLVFEAFLSLRVRWHASFFGGICIVLPFFRGPSFFSEEKVLLNLFPFSNILLLAVTPPPAHRLPSEMV